MEFYTAGFKRLGVGDLWEMPAGLTGATIAGMFESSRQILSRRIVFTPYERVRFCLPRLLSYHVCHGNDLKASVMDNRASSLKHPWMLYLLAGVLLYWGGNWLTEYVRNGYVLNAKERVIYSGTEGLVVSLVPLLAGAVVLSCAMWSSYKVYKSRKKDDT